MPQNITAPGRFWVVRKPDEQGTVVAKFETTADDPSSIPYEIPDSCIAYQVASRKALENQTVDTSVLTDEEKQVLGVT